MRPKRVILFFHTERKRNQMKFKAMVIRTNDTNFSRAIEERNVSDLPAGDVLIRVSYSSLNYKDALSAIGNRGVTRTYPHTPGIDAAGIVAESTSTLFKAGDEVIVTGYDLGMDTDGGFGAYVRVPAGWVVPLPANLSSFEAMQLGTAGFTAGQGLTKLLRNGLQPDQGEVLVTGATGGVGSLAVAILKKNGFRVVAATRKTTESEFLLSLGAESVIDSASLLYNPQKPLVKGRWAGVIDTVGGGILAGAIAACKPFGSVAACGLTLSHEFSTTVFPFILRGNNLLGINSAEIPMHERLQIWNHLASDWKPFLPDSFSTVCSLSETIEKIDVILAGKMRGRVVVRPE
jgi:putative YhdH/YhfP family quinone oxidoreductase